MTEICDKCGTETHPPGQHGSMIRDEDGHTFCSHACKEKFQEDGGYLPSSFSVEDKSVHELNEKIMELRDKAMETDDPEKAEELEEAAQGLIAEKDKRIRNDVREELDGGDA